MAFRGFCIWTLHFFKQWYVLFQWLTEEGRGFLVSLLLMQMLNSLGPTFIWEGLTESSSPLIYPQHKHLHQQESNTHAYITASSTLWLLGMLFWGACLGEECICTERVTQSADPCAVQLQWATRWIRPPACPAG